MNTDNKKQTQMQPRVTIFKNIKETEAPFHRELEVVLLRIKNGATKKLVKEIRQTKDKIERNDLKKRLPAICFSGIFQKRKDTSIEEHSGIICLDFDGYEKKKILLEHKERLSKDQYVYSVFISPSGNGLKALIKIPADINNHVNYFNSLEKYFDSKYFDKTSKNISRVCYESYDPLIHINDKSSLWDTIAEPEYNEVVKNRDTPTIPITDENKIVDILVKWWTKKFPMDDGQRNQHAYVLAAAFNDYGINKSLAGYVLNQYEDAANDFSKAEIERTIDSAYSQTANFGTKYYEDEDKVNAIKSKMMRGVSKKEIRLQLEDAGIDGDNIESVINIIEKENAQQTFWEKNEKGVIKLVHFSFKKFLEDNGFYKYCPEGSKNYVFVKVTNNLIDHTSEKEIKDYVLNYLIELDDLSIYNYFADCVRYFREEFLTLLSTIDIYFIEDSKDASFIYYNNCAVKITKDGIEPIDYLDLGGYVWKDHVIDRKFTMCDAEGSDYKVFISRISNDDKQRVQTMESTIGFMMHGHKNLSYCPAVILNDEVMKETPEGGTGKGLFMNALSQMKKLVVIDGKQFAFEKSFPYQLVSADTQILCFDDVKKNFDFERLFSVVTEGMTLEKKNKDAIKIPFSKSPKIGITTNYAIRGSGNSFARRKWEVELHSAYNKNYTPLDEFGKHFFSEWDDDEWCLFDNYMIFCLQGYLSTGLIESESANKKVKDLGQKTHHEFIEWCGLIQGSEKPDSLETGVRLETINLYNEFKRDYPEQQSLSAIAFNRWLIEYSIYLTGESPKIGRTSSGKWMQIKRVSTINF